MKIFIRTSSLAEKSPQIFAMYSADAHVAADAHGPEMTMLEVPEMRFERLPDASSATGAETFPRLPEDWRERLSQPIMQAEAERRINEVLPPSEQLASLSELVMLLMQHGYDPSAWPEDAKARKAEIEHAWNYVRDVKARARSHRTAPFDPTGDKNWPTRIVK